MRVQAFLFCVAILISSQAIAETRSVKRSFSGGSSSADSIALHSNKKSEQSASLGADAARAMPRSETLAARSEGEQKSKVRTVKRSLSGGSGMADEIRLGSAK